MFITYFCYRCKCKTFGVISLEEFSTGLASFKADTVSQVKSHIITIKGDLLDITTSDFKNYYYFLFEYFMQSKTKKLLDFDYVESQFNSLFGNQFKLVKTFLEWYVIVKKKEAMKQDQWNCFLNLLMKIGDNFPKGYSLKDSWPTLFDEFYIDYCTKNNIDMTEDDEFLA